jgi:MSHA pilin protein MshC
MVRNVIQMCGAPSGAPLPFSTTPMGPRALGFTLVELVTTLVILGVLTAAAAPRFFDTQPFAARAYADELASAARFARQVAIATQCPVQVAIDENGYTLLQRGSSASENTCLSAGPWVQPVVTSENTALGGTTPANVSVTPQVTFTFDKDGQVSPSAVPSISIDTFAVNVSSFGTVVVTP